jgi:hypothetical protein
MTTSVAPTKYERQVDSQAPPSQSIRQLSSGGSFKCPIHQPSARYAELPYDQMTPEQQNGYRSLVETRGPLGGPNKIWVHNPGLAKVMGTLGAYFRTGYSLSEREREIAVIIINS